MTTNPYEAPASDVQANIAQTYQPKIFSLDGRIGRLRYFAYSLVGFGVMILAGGLVGVFGGADLLADEANNSPIMAILYLPLIILTVIFTKRRFNDMNRSGWFVLLNLIPFVNLIVFFWLALGRGTDGENKFGPAPTRNPLSVKIFGSLAAFVPVLGILAAIAIPAYQDYVERAQAYSSE